MKPFDFIWSDSYVLVLGQVPKQRGVSHRRPQKSASNWCTSSTSSKLAAVLEPFGKDFQGDRRCQEISGVSFDRSHCHRVPVPTNPHLEIGLCRAPGINTIKLFCCNWWLHQFSLDYVEGFLWKLTKTRITLQILAINVLLYIAAKKFYIIAPRTLRKTKFRNWTEFWIVEMLEPGSTRPTCCSSRNGASSSSVTGKTTRSNSFQFTWVPNVLELWKHEPNEMNQISC